MPFPPQLCSSLCEIKQRQAIGDVDDGKATDRARGAKEDEWWRDQRECGGTQRRARCPAHEASCQTRDQEQWVPKNEETGKNIANTNPTLLFLFIWYISELYGERKLHHVCGEILFRRSFLFLHSMNVCMHENVWALLCWIKRGYDWSPTIL